MFAFALAGVGAVASIAGLFLAEVNPALTWVEASGQAAMGGALIWILKKVLDGTLVVRPVAEAEATLKRMLDEHRTYRERSEERELEYAAIVRELRQDAYDRRTHHEQRPPGRERREP